MFARLVALFVFVPLIELYLLVTIGMRIGVYTTIGIAIVTGILGAALAKREGLKTMEQARQLAATGQMPTDAMIEGVLILLAAAVLVTPGFLTDTTGFLLLFPPMRAIVRESIKKRMQPQVVMRSYYPGSQPHPVNPDTQPEQQVPKPGAKKPDIVVPPKVDDKDMN